MAAWTAPPQHRARPPAQASGPRLAARLFRFSVTDVPPRAAGRVPALEPDFRELTLLLEHGPGHLPGLVGRLRRPRVQENVRLFRGDRNVIAQAIAQKIAIRIPLPRYR